MDNKNIYFYARVSSSGKKQLFIIDALKNTRILDGL